MIEALAWAGFGLLMLSNVAMFVASTVKISRGEYPVAAISVYWLLTGWFTWSCVHLLRFT